MEAGGGVFVVADALGIRAAGACGQLCRIGGKKVAACHSGAAYVVVCRVVLPLKKLGNKGHTHELSVLYLAEVSGAGV